MGVSQGCLLSPIINYLIQFILFRSSYMMTYSCAKFKENPCVGTFVTPPFRFKKKRNCIIHEAETKVLISCVVTAQLICTFVFACFMCCWFSCVGSNDFCAIFSKVQGLEI